MKKWLKIFLIILVLLIVIFGVYSIHIKKELNKARVIYLTQADCVSSCPEDQILTKTDREFHFSASCLQECASVNYPRVKIGKNNPFLKNSEAIHIRDDIVECGVMNQQGTYNSFEELRSCYKNILDKYPLN